MTFTNMFSPSEFHDMVTGVTTCSGTKTYQQSPGTIARPPAPLGLPPLPDGRVASPTLTAALEAAISAGSSEDGNEAKKLGKSESTVSSIGRPEEVIWFANSSNEESITILNPVPPGVERRNQKVDGATYQSFGSIALLLADAATSNPLISNARAMAPKATNPPNNSVTSQSQMLESSTDRDQTCGPRQDPPGQHIDEGNSEDKPDVTSMNGDGLSSQNYDFQNDIQKRPSILSSLSGSSSKDREDLDSLLVATSVANGHASSEQKNSQMSSALDSLFSYVPNMIGPYRKDDVSGSQREYGSKVRSRQLPVVQYPVLMLPSPSTTSSNDDVMRAVEQTLRNVVHTEKPGRGRRDFTKLGKLGAEMDIAASKNGREKMMNIGKTHKTQQTQMNPPWALMGSYEENPLTPLESEEDELEFSIDSGNEIWRKSSSSDIDVDNPFKGTKKLPAKPRRLLMTGDGRPFIPNDSSYTERGITGASSRRKSATYHERTIASGSSSDSDWPTPRCPSRRTKILQESPKHRRASKGRDHQAPKRTDRLSMERGKTSSRRKQYAGSKTADRSQGSSWQHEITPYGRGRVDTSSSTESCLENEKAHNKRNIPNRTMDRIKDRSYSENAQSHNKHNTPDRRTDRIKNPKYSKTVGKLRSSMHARTSIPLDTAVGGSYLQPGNSTDSVETPRALRSNQSSSSDEREHTSIKKVFASGQTSGAKSRRAERMKLVRHSVRKQRTVPLN